MIGIIITVIGVVAFYLAGGRDVTDLFDPPHKLKIYGAAILCFIGLIILAIPDKSLDEDIDWECVKSTELVSLSNTVVSQGGGLMYVSILAENVYTYRYEIDSPFGTDTSKEYIVDTISGNVEEIEDPKCEVPLLLKYRSKPRVKIGLWNIIISFGGETKYIFYVPEGTIQKEIQLT